MVDGVTHKWKGLVRFSLLCFLVNVLVAAPKREVRVRPGDAIRLFVYEGLYVTEKGKFVSMFHDKEFILNGDGEIILGSLGRVPIAGLKAEEIAEVLQEKFKPFAKDCMIIVIPLVRVTLRGAFNARGMYRFDLDMSFWQMVKEAGGFSTLSSVDEIYIVRGKEILYRNFAEALYQGQSLYELGIQSGDEIVAPTINRLSFETIMRYTQFVMSIMIFYFSMVNYFNKKQ